MKAPAIHGRIERRILVDHLVPPDAVAALIPDGFELRLVHGQAVVGMCLIHLHRLRPGPLPRWSGASVEAVAHRVSVWGPGPGGPVGGVYVPRRDTTSWPASVVGGRAFPGVHGLARIDVEDSGECIAISATNADGTTIDVAVHRPSSPGVCAHDHRGCGGAHTPGGGGGGEGEGGGSAGGGDRAEALSSLHRSELLAWSPDRTGRGLEVAEMRCHQWATAPVVVERASSSWLAGQPGLGGGVLASPSALLMEDLDMTWSAPR